MKKSTLFSYGHNSTRGGVIISLMFALSCLVAVSCSETGVTSNDTIPTVDKSLASGSFDAYSVLDSRGMSEIPGKNHAKKTQVANGNGFAGPLFGLATAQNGDILVADAGAGVATLDGTTDIPQPGITDISTLGRGSMWASTGAGGDPEHDTGQALYRLSQGKNKLIVNLFAFEDENDPDDPDGTKPSDSNPFDVQSLGGQAALVADAGGNDLLRVNDRGQVEVLAVFPNELVSTESIKDLVGCPNESELCGLPPQIPAEAVPTSIAIGPDGYYYVGELKGFPAPTGASNIWRVSPDASWAECGSSPDCVKVFEGGFTSIIDLAFDENGILYVAELDERSWFAVEFLDPATLAGGTINACDLGTVMCSEVATGIPILTAITFDSDGNLWATKNALIPGLAEVIEIP